MLPNDRPDPAATPVAPSSEAPAQRSGARRGATGATNRVQRSPGQKGRKAAVRAAPGRYGRAAPLLPQVQRVAMPRPRDRFVLAAEGIHEISLRPRSGGGFRYEWVRFQSITGELIVRAADSRRDAVLSALYWAECRHAWPLGPSGPCCAGPGFAVNLHAYLCGWQFPLDASRLSAADAAAIPRAVLFQWGS